MDQNEMFEQVGKLYAGGKLGEAKELLKTVDATFGRSHNSLFFEGLFLFPSGDYARALELLMEAHKINPEDLRVIFNIGSALVQMEQYADAMGWFKKVIVKKPDHIPSLLTISAIFDTTGNPTSCEHTCNIILKIDPNNASALNNLGNACKNSGKPQEAVINYQRALELNPEIDSIRSNLLFSLNYASRNPEGLREDHKAFASYWDRPKWDEKAKPLNGRKLRVGVVSADFCVHSVAYFLTGLYKHLNREQFELTSYANVEHPDFRTDVFKVQSDHWVDIKGLTPEAAADRIHEDHMDILIDLGGHTRRSNLPIFGYQPAPVQVTWLGYPATTGMKTMQYRFTDPIADPEGTENAYTEKLYRLPHFLNYTHREVIPECDFSATKERDYMLFGSFNNIAKMSPETIELWGAVLYAVPDSKLLIKHKYFNDPGVQKLFLEEFRQAGISPDRLIFHSYSFNGSEHLQEYHQVDIALDSFPYNGTTTTFEALVMGVPTLTLTGEVHAARVGTTIMKGVGLSQFTAATPEEFVQRAVELSSDREALLNLKKGLREEFYISPLANQKSFTKSFEMALMAIWEESCE